MEAENKKGQEKKQDQLCPMNNFKPCIAEKCAWHNKGYNFGWIGCSVWIIPEILEGIRGRYET